MGFSCLCGAEGIPARAQSALVLLLCPPLAPAAPNPCGKSLQHWPGSHSCQAGGSAHWDQITRVQQSGFPWGWGWAAPGTSLPTGNSITGGNHLRTNQGFCIDQCSKERCEVYPACAIWLRLSEKPARDQGTVLGEGVIYLGLIFHLLEKQTRLFPALYKSDKDALVSWEASTWEAT